MQSELVVQVLTKYLHRNHSLLILGVQIKAFEYFAAGALRGQLESGIHVAVFNIRGHPNAKRNPALAMEYVLIFLL
jgi:hypothetical protein